ncbi:GTP-binding protein 2-like, partial [Plectropomus leopardus]|uniref:GTP-binding protein 2-like n=1 Tax=Plectropomus leopardus TaxID=160734 RepID=UPI001C4B98C0
MVDLSESGAVSPGHIRHGNTGKKTSKKSRTRRGKRGRKRKNKKTNRNSRTPPPFFPPEAEEGNIEYKVINSLCPALIYFTSPYKVYKVYKVQDVLH